MMKQDLCKYLPADLIMMILLRLPTETIIRCKYVCKSLRDLIESCEFGKFHFCNSKSVPGLAAQGLWSEDYTFYNFVEEHEHAPEYLSIAMKFTLPTHRDHILIQGSVNGLILFFDARTQNSFVCNPVTRDYIMLPCPSLDFQQSFGFGVSKMSGEYKIVRVLSYKFEVYTLGTRSWRSVASSSYPYNTTATFVNGNLHWLLSDSSGKVVGISCFDLDSELFITFFPPDECYNAIISAYEECMALCSTAHEGYVIWLMKEYGDDKSWTRKIIISYGTFFSGYGLLIPIKAFKDEDVLVARTTSSRLLVYFHTSKPPVSYSHIDILGWTAFSYTPSFLSLKTFSEEVVCSF